MLNQLCSGLTTFMDLSAIMLNQLYSGSTTFMDLSAITVYFV